MDDASTPPDASKDSGKPDGAKSDHEVLREADALDLHEQRPTTPADGFGKRWRKVHRIALTGADIPPEHLIQTWKQHFGEFWPGQNRFFGPITALEPGELAVISLEMPADVTLSTGVILVDATPTGFTLITPKGHMLCGWLHFSAFRTDRTTFAQVQMLIRASDPLFEIGMVVAGHRRENHFWEDTLRNLAAHFGIQAEPETQVTCEDPHYQWENAKNIWHNGAIRNGLIRLAAIPRTAIDLLSRRKAERTS
jgi:hypothetical protein